MLFLLAGSLLLVGHLGSDSTGLDSSWAWRELCRCSPCSRQALGLAVALEACHSASKPFSDPHAPRPPTSDATQRTPMLPTVSLLHPHPTSGMAWDDHVLGATRQQGNLPSGDKDKYHV